MLKTNRGIIQKIRKSRTFRGVSALLLFSMLFEIAQPTVSLALTEGPSQPEVQSFEPVTTTQMVDLFSGDFNYNIPLFNLPGPNGGYPVNLAYHAGTSMDDEASWVGLGWNINAGSLVRDVRGLPDDFKTAEVSDGQAATTGDHLIVKQDHKPNRTIGGSVTVPLEALGADLTASISATLSVYYNNYRGMGVGVGMNFAKSNDSPFALGLSLDGDNGLGVTATIKNGDPVAAPDGSSTQNTTSHSLSLNFDGNLSIGYAIKKSERAYAAPDKDGKRALTSGTDSNFGTGYSFARNTYTPSMAARSNSNNIKVGVSGGPFATGFFAKGSFDVWYNWETLDDTDKSGRRTPVVGYERSDAVGGGYLRDYSRNGDGQLTRASIFLAKANYMYDTYNSTGQGLSGYFRAKRNDLGKVGNEQMTGTSQGANFQIELGVGTGGQWGLDFGLNWGDSYQGFWDNDDNAELSVDFSDPFPHGIDERMYYQAHGETTVLHPSEYDNLNGLKLATAYFSPKDNDGLHNGKRKIENEYNEWYGAERDHANMGRVVRNTLIHTLKNSEVSKLGEFNFGYFSANASLYVNPDMSYAAIRNSRTMTIDGSGSAIDISHHNAGFKVLNQEGSYYVYGLPAYNLKEVQNTFSSEGIYPSERTKSFGNVGAEVDYKIQGTHESIHKSTKTPFAHSYLLTSVLGADFIDLTNNGPSNDDMGYWVKFDYVQSAQNYNWRAPYENNLGQVSAGASYTTDDDRLSYQYGEKEIWYLGRIETKTHIAVFITDKPSDSDKRWDGKEANGEHPGATSTSSDGSRKLKEIRVFDKKSFAASGVNAVPLQVVHFEYDYSLCQDVPNNSNPSATDPDGKLTLKKVWFENNGSSRGELNKYEFEYAGSPTNPGINPAYAYGAFDAWGVYRPETTDPEHQMRFPYVNQFNQDFILPSAAYYGGNTKEDAAAKTVTKQNQDNYAAAWCLTKIKLPSGGTINIQYESDDYGYVQHKTANQMFKITRMGDFTEPNELYNTGSETYYDAGNDDDNQRRRIYFKLEYPIPVGTAGIPAKIYDDYVDPIIADESGNKNLYFKSRIRLTRTPDVYEYISGYLPLEAYSEIDYGVSGYAGHTATIDGVQCHTHGFVTVQATKKKHKNNGNVVYFEYHPMALAAWTYLQTNAQELLNNPNSFSSLGDMDKNQVLGKVIDLLNAVPNLAQSFGAIRSYCKDKDMARFIDLNKSCVRLASPDKIKYGGGHRVKQISMTDNWSDDTGVPNETRTYGQRFEYTLTEGGKTISSGVAQYEPMPSGDENALKYPINYYDKQTIFTRNNLFAEGPHNEELFPGASVGYRKVTVKSLHTDDQIRNAADGNPTTTPKGRTAGVTVSEFYTAKEFPTIVKWSDLKEENDTKEIFHLPIIVPFIGSLKRDYFYGSQSFLIELNDMHGKPKSVKAFELNNYAVGQDPISASEYEYQAQTITYQGETVLQLDNNVRIIPNDGTHTVLKNGQNQEQTRLMGVEVDMSTDQREFYSKHHDFALDFNLALVLPVIGTISFWPTINDSKTMFRTYVTNKVVHRTGILKRTKVQDFQTTDESEIIAYDEKSGIPLLTKIKNEFGDDFYSYNVPSYYAYDRMGHAYRNINYTFTADLAYSNTPGAGGSPYLEFNGTDHLNHLVRGDELLLLETTSAADKYQKVYFLGWKYVGGTVMGILHSPFGNIHTAGSGFVLKVIRSGRRNQFGTTVSNYLTKGKVEDLIRMNPSTSGQIDLVNVDPADNLVKTPRIYTNVLSASALVLRDDWSTSIQTDLSSDLITENPFLTGNSGIWRRYKDYTYVGKRKTSASMTGNTASDPKLYEDGVFDAPVEMFTWNLGNIEDYVSRWEWTNEVTRYSNDAYELENRNRLGIYASALYGYDNNLSIGVGSNAAYNEIGVMDFETIAGGSDFAKVLSQTNFNFDNAHNMSGSGYTNIVTEQYKIRRSTIEGNNIVINAADCDIPASYFSGDGFRMVGLSLTSRKTSGILGNLGYYFNGLLFKNSGTQLKYELFLRRGLHEKLLPEGGDYHGIITYFIPREHLDNHSSGVTYTSEKAHSGKKSLKVTSDVVFDQPRLKFVGDKTYVLSAWVSKNGNPSTFKPVSGSLIEVGRINAGAFSALPVTPVVTYGKIVEGWQKVDIEFKWDAANPTAIPALRFTAGSGLYVDDIRVSPKKGGIMSYVFDPINYLLSASLNADNYATFYYYDEQGSLHMQKQETEQGIFTIKGARRHVAQ